jgi:hypothetical protein
LSAACVERSEKALAANPANREAITKEYFDCQNAVNTQARTEGQRAQACAQPLLAADPFSMNRDGFYEAVQACAHK